MSRRRSHWIAVPTLAVALVSGCGAPADDAAPAAAAAGGGASAVKDDVSSPDVVKIAVGSADHTTLVTALKAADLVDVMSATGPYTVFAPTNAAFELLPAGTVEGLLKPEKKSDLSRILQHHVTTSALNLDFFENGQEIGMVDGTKATITHRDGATYIDDAKVVASIRASNGWVHVIDKVVLPKS